MPGCRHRKIAQRIVIETLYPMPFNSIETKHISITYNTIQINEDYGEKKMLWEIELFKANPLIHINPIIIWPT